MDLHEFFCYIHVLKRMAKRKKTEISAQQLIFGIKRWVLSEHNYHKVSYGTMWVSEPRCTDFLPPPHVLGTDYCGKTKT